MYIVISGPRRGDDDPHIEAYEKTDSTQDQAQGSSDHDPSAMMG